MAPDSTVSSQSNLKYHSFLYGFVWTHELNNCSCNWTANYADNLPQKESTNFYTREHKFYNNESIYLNLFFFLTLLTHKSYFSPKKKKYKSKSRFPYNCCYQITYGLENSIPAMIPRESTQLVECCIQKSFNPRLQTFSSFQWNARHKCQVCHK